MSTHVQINGQEDDEQLRLLSEPCSFCDARAGEPCRIVIVKGDTGVELRNSRSGGP